MVYNWFLDPVPREGGTGSGSIIDPKGYVLTNYHVIENATTLKVTLADGVEQQATVVGADKHNDLAIIKFDPQGKTLKTIPMASTDNLEVGQKVLAIGNPFALERTLTTGIISGLGRPIVTQTGLIIRDMIQTDASINPGNSGGPLLNYKGEMIGVNTMIYSPSGGSIGIGFAVPIKTARRVIPDLMKYGMVKRGWIDVDFIPLFDDLVRYDRLNVSEGILITDVTPGSEAAKAGLLGGDKRRAVRYRRTIIYLGGDIIVEVDGKAVASLTDLLDALEDNKPGETIIIKIVRNKNFQTLNIKLSERPDNMQW